MVLCLSFPSHDSNGENPINPKIWRYRVIIIIMFSCGTKKSNVRSRREQGRDSTVVDSPVTPARTSFHDNAVPNRPTTGTPVPWAPRLSVLARYSFIHFASSPKSASKFAFCFQLFFRFDCVGFLRSTELEKATTQILPNLFSSASFRKWFVMSRTFCYTSEFLVRTV